MPACNLEREVNGGTAFYRIAGRFEGACARDLSSRLQSEPLHDVVVDFSRVSEFVDSGVAVLAGSLSSSSHTVHLRGLRQHQERLFRYFGIEPSELPPALAPAPPAHGAAAAKEVA